MLVGDAPAEETHTTVVCDSTQWSSVVKERCSGKAVLQFATGPENLLLVVT